MDKLYNLVYCSEISFRKLLNVLKEEASQLSIREIIKASLFLIEDSKYVQTGYRKEFIKSYTQAFLTRIKEVKECKMENDSSVDFQELEKALKLLKEQKENGEVIEGFDSALFRIYQIISIYTTFIVKESVHPVETPFPGGFKVKYEDDTYLCPVKERQKDNPSAVCGFCIAEQDPEII
jgi:uncharacterized protein (UPF0305 family)